PLTSTRAPRGSRRVSPRPQAVPQAAPTERFVTEVDFHELAKQGYTRVPVLAEARADLYTPLAVYVKLANGPYSYLLESVVGGERFGRYSFIGLACAERIEARGRTVRRLLRDARGADVCLEKLDGADPFEYARGWLKRHRVAPAPAALRFRGGLVGPLPESMVLTRFKDLDSNAQAFEHSFTQPAFLEAVRLSKEHIFAGDCMQVQISQRTSRPFDATPLSLYRALRGLNPSPYMFYFDFNDHHVVGASPEILVRLSADTITLRPIAGTRPRGGTPEEDAAIAEELLADPKERAEHVMLIDLGRNDVGRVAATGSV